MVHNPPISEATPEEIAALRGERVASASAARAAPKGGAKATAKAKAAKSKPRHKPPREDEVDPNASQAEEEPEPTPKPSHPRKGNGGKKKKKPSTPEESMETPIMSPPPKKTGEGPVPRRLSFKAPDPVQSRQIDALQEARLIVIALNLVHCPAHLWLIPNPSVFGRTMRN